MSLELTTSEQELEAKWLDKLRTTYKIKEDRFKMGMEFASLVVDGEAKIVAYEKAFGCDRRFAVSSATTFFRSKWVQELIRYMSADDSVEYITEVKTTIKVLMEIIKDPRASYRERTEASKALQPYIKQEKARIEVELNVNNDGELSMIEQVVGLAKNLAQNGKMINTSGEVIDAVLID